MGRLVLDDNGVGRFAGSTTGVHFVLSVQAALRQRGLFEDWFPESCFRLHLLHPSPPGSLTIPLPQMETIVETNKILPLIKRLIDYPVTFYVGHLRLYVTSWSALCPVVAAGELQGQLAMIYTRINEGGSHLNDEECSVLFNCLMVVCINHISLPPEQLQPYTLSENLEMFMKLADALLPFVISGQRLASIQGLALLSFFYQLTGQHLHMAHIRGLLVQLAMSTGLHRHSRRFKFPTGEVEMRRRLWWWIYIVDKSVSQHRKRDSLSGLRSCRLTAIVHGLPRMINDVDVDVDYPIDCDLDTLSVTELPIPLPGESTPVLEFITFTHLSRIMSTTLSQLYTTTDRRGGEEKISRLRRDLQAWKHRFGCSSENQVATGHTGSMTTPPLMQLWLPLMENVTMLLINRPGLTFDADTTAFQECLNVCAETCSTIVAIIRDYHKQVPINALVPPSNSLIFQCALMHIFYHCQGQDSHSTARIPVSTSAELVKECIEILSANVADLSDDRSSSLHASVLNCTSLLRMLYNTVFTENSTVGEDRSSIFGSPELATVLEPNNAYPESSPGMPDTSGGNALESLNHLDWLDWIVDSEISPFHLSSVDF